MIMDTPEQHPLHAPKLNVVPSEFAPTYKDDGITMSIVAPSLFKNKQSPEEAQASADPNKPTPIPIPSVVESVAPLFYLNAHIRDSNTQYEINVPPSSAMAVLCL